MLDKLVSQLAAAGITLDDGVLARELSFLEELLRWNRQVNLTSIRDHDQALEKHLVDSLLLLSRLPEQGCMLDMGSGAGLPGIPLAIARKGLHVVSVDSVGKKINFQKHIKRTLGLANLRPVNARIENLGDELGGKEPFDLVVARALTSLDQLISLADPWLKPGGRLFAMKGPEGREELLVLKEKGAGGGFQEVDRVGYALPQSGADRLLIVLEKGPVN